MKYLIQKPHNMIVCNPINQLKVKILQLLGD